MAMMYLHHVPFLVSRVTGYCLFLWTYWFCNRVGQKIQTPLNLPQWPDVDVSRYQQLAVGS